MKTILYLYPTWERAKQGFKEFIEHNVPNNVRYHNLTAQGDGFLYKFATPESANMIGMEITSVWLDEGVNMSDEQNALLRSRMR